MCVYANHEIFLNYYVKNYWKIGLNFNLFLDHQPINYVNLSPHVTKTIMMDVEITYYFHMTYIAKGQNCQTLYIYLQLNQKCVNV